MSEGYQLEVPEFASLLRAPCDPNGICNECCNLFGTFAANYGILNTPVNPTPNCVCHDICVEEVTMICAQPINRAVSYPPFGPCRLGGVNLPVLPNNATCNVFVSCAQEALNAGCQSITITVGLYIVCGTVVVPTCFTVTCDTFFDFPSGVAVSGSDLQQRLREIDGSCIVIQLNARTNATGDQIQITGKIIDKLWKHENLWVTGIRPYDLSPGDRTANGFISLTIKEEFDPPHAIPACNNFLCPCP